MIVVKCFKCSLKKSYKYFKEIEDQKLCAGGGTHYNQEYYILKEIDSVPYRLKRGKIITYIVVDENDSPLVIAPLEKCTGKNWIVNGDAEWFDYIDFIYADKSDVVLKKAFNVLLNRFKKDGCQELKWRFLDEKSISYSFICEYTVKDEIVKNVSIEFKSNEYERYKASLSKHTRQNLRTTYNRIEKDGHTYSFKYFGIGKQENRTQTAELCFDVYYARQSSKYKKSGLLYKLSFKIFHYITRVILEGKGIMAVFFIDDQVAAFMQGFYRNGYNFVEIPRLAYNEKFSFYSPGMCLIDKTIEYLSNGFEFKVNKLDLCRGTENYKYKMGGKTYFTHNIRLILK